MYLDFPTTTNLPKGEESAMKEPMGQRFFVHLDNIDGGFPESARNTATAEVIARTETEAREVALGAPYSVRISPQQISFKPVHETGARVTNVTRGEAFDIPTFVRWRGVA